MKNNSPAKKPFTKRFQKKAPTPDFECAFLILDLAEKSTKGKIIRITELLLAKNGETDFNQYLFSNEGIAISEEANIYHNISEADLVGKPLLTTYNFKKAKNIVVWDGHTTTSILKANNIRQTAPIINLLSLARFKEKEHKTIALKKYAAIAQPQIKHVLEMHLRKPENKVFSLSAIYNFLKKEYLEKFNMNNPAFLCAAGRARDKASFDAAIEKAAVRHKEFLAKEAKSKIKVQPAVAKTTISVTLGSNYTKQGVTAVTVLKRKKS